MLDFMSLVPESMLADLWFWSDHGTPRGWMYMDGQSREHVVNALDSALTETQRRGVHAQGWASQHDIELSALIVIAGSCCLPRAGYPIHAFKWVNAAGAATYIKYKLVSAQGIANLSQAEAQRVCGVDPDFSKREMWQHINSGGVAEWIVNVQMIPEAEIDRLPDAFDCSKPWPEDQFPLTEIGRIIMDKNVRHTRHHACLRRVESAMWLSVERELTYVTCRLARCSSMRVRSRRTTIATWSRSRSRRAVSCQVRSARAGCVLGRRVLVLMLTCTRVRVRVDAGIEPTPDPLLQWRTWLLVDAQVSQSLISLREFCECVSLECTLADLLSDAAP